MTPSNRYEANQALQALQSGEEHTTTVRRLFTRTTTNIERLQFALTMQTEELQKLQAIESLRKRKLTGKRKVSPNEAFATVHDLLGSQIPPNVASTARTEANSGQIRQEQRGGDVQDHADAFGAIATNLSSIVFG
jgi:hypothetical protein